MRRPPETQDCNRLCLVGGTRTDEEIEATSRYFRSGEGHLEVVQTLVGQDMVVVVAIEHQHGEVGDFPDQDWSFRVTLVFVRQDGQWKLVHRHADALVRPTMDRLAGLAGGAG